MTKLVPQKEQIRSSLVYSLESGRPGVTHPSIAVDSLKVITCVGNAFLHGHSGPLPWSAQFEASQGRRSSRTAAQKFLPLLCAPASTQDMNKFIFLILPRGQSVIRVTISVECLDLQSSHSAVATL
jgi:hypothetical protein